MLTRIATVTTAAALVTGGVFTGPGDGTDLHNTTEGWGAFRDGAEGVDLAAGETGVFQLFAPVPARASLKGSVVTCCAFGDPILPHPCNPVANDSARVLAPID